MPERIAPVKTIEGQAELTQRTRGLSQRHRTVLFLVDGRRSAAEIRALAAQAGAPESCFDELVQLGMIDCPDGLDSAPGLAPEDSSLLPPAQTLPPDSDWMDSTSNGAHVPDGPFEEARGILVRAVRNEAPVTGSLLLRKLRRAATRDELEELLDEVEQRIRKPRKMIIVAQTMRHVRHLLSLPE